MSPPVNGWRWGACRWCFRDCPSSSDYFPSKYLKSKISALLQPPGGPARPAQTDHLRTLIEVGVPAALGFEGGAKLVAAARFDDAGLDPGRAHLRAEGFFEHAPRILGAGDDAVRRPHAAAGAG